MSQSMKSPDPFSPLQSGSAEPYTPTDADREEAGVIMDKFRRCANARAQRDADWSFYKSFIEGNQLWYVSNATGNTVQVVDPSKRRRHSMFNVLKPTIRSLRGKFSQSVPTFSVRPGMGGMKETGGAKVGDRLNEWYWDKERIQDKYKECVGDMAYAAVGWLHQYWNPFAGEEVGHCPACGWTSTYSWETLPGKDSEKPCPDCQEEMLRIWTGDVECRHVSPFDVFVPPNVTHWEDFEYTFSQEAFPVSLLAKWYPQFAAYLKADSNTLPGFGGRNVYHLATGMWQAEEMYEQAQLVRYYERASGMYSNGREVHLINGHIVFSAEMPYPMKYVPFYPFSWESTSGEFYPVPPMADAWPRQKELNELETVFREYAELVVRPKIIIPWGTKVAQDEVTAVTGQVISPMPQFANTIKFLTWPELPPFMLQRREQLIADIRLIFGVTQAEINAPVDGSGRTLAIQQAESDQSVGHIVSPHHTQLQRLSYDALNMMRLLSPPSRKKLLMGDDGPLVADFQELDFGHGWSVALEPDDGLPKNKALRTQEVMNLAGAHFFDDPKTGMFSPALAAKAAKLKIPGLGPDMVDTEMVAARGAISELKSGPNYIPQDEDGAEQYITELMGWLRTTGRIKGKEDPSFVLRVRQLLRYYMQKQAAAQAAAAQAAQPGAAGMPSPPNSSQSAPGGSPNKPEQSTGSPVMDQAKQAITQADKTGRNLAQAS